MLLELLLCCVAFFTTVLGLAWPLARRLPLEAAEKLVASASLSLLAVYLVTWVWYLSNLGTAWLWILPVLAIFGLGLGWRTLETTLRTRSVLPLLRGQMLVSAWCLGWLALVATYSGGGWTGDWFEHWERAKFFIERGPPDTVFIGHAAVTARPPLANVVTAAFLAVTRIDFAHYQIFSTLLASVAFLPAALLVRRFARTPGGGGADGGGDRLVAVLTALVLLNPLFVQNATFAWTKLPAAFFSLCGVYFFLSALRAERPLPAASLASSALAAGILAHYSTGPYVVVLALGWMAVSWRRRPEAGWWRATAAAIGIGAGDLDRQANVVPWR